MNPATVTPPAERKQPTSPVSEKPTALSRPAAVVLHIDELVLHGFPAGARHRIGEAFERELTRLLTEQGVPSAFNHSSEIDRLPGGSFQFSADVRPESTGIEIARVVFGGFKR